MKMSSDKKKNMRSAIKKIKEACKKKAKIICLPELFLSNYFCQQEKHSNFDLAEKIPGKTTNIFCSLAKELKIIIILPIFEKKTSGIYHNSLVLINEKGKLIGKYRNCLLYTSPSPRDRTRSRMPSSA